MYPPIARLVSSSQTVCHDPVQTALNPTVVRSGTALPAASVSVTVATVAPLESAARASAQAAGEPPKVMLACAGSHATPLELMTSTSAVTVAVAPESAAELPTEVVKRPCASVVPTLALTVAPSAVARTVSPGIGRSSESTAVRRKVAVAAP